MIHLALVLLIQLIPDLFDSSSIMKCNFSSLSLASCPCLGLAISLGLANCILLGLGIPFSFRFSQPLSIRTTSCSRFPDPDYIMVPIIYFYIKILLDYLLQVPGLLLGLLELLLGLVRLLLFFRFDGFIGEPFILWFINIPATNIFPHRLIKILVCNFPRLVRLLLKGSWYLL